AIARKHFDIIRLSEEQRGVVRCALNFPGNLFFTCGAGTGESVVLRRIIELLPATTTFVTAATGLFHDRLEATQKYSGKTNQFNPEYSAATGVHSILALH
ncbi:hypothetical protein KIN20_022805, partial [Parelaphostrongylus tenuis]